MKNIIIYITLFFIPFCISAQTNPDAKRDYQWLFGYRAYKIGANLMDFNTNKIKIADTNLFGGKG